jgi:alkanesulfonate monooxygenase SsuD/methylene tetrahydromethanopterin reductase-like flavin-dependent oxidoreductase (luciferase family)
MAMEVGIPRLVLGAWASDLQLRRAASEYDGWMTSAGPGTARGGWKKVFSEGIKRYRDLGGKRALISTMLIDLKMPDTPMPEDGGFILACTPATAAERLNALAELGFDDVIIKPVNYQRDGNTMEVFDYTSEDLQLYRSLVPKDARDYQAA